MRFRGYLVWFHLLPLAAAADAEAEESLARRLARTPNLVDAATVVKDLRVELQYARPDNILKVSLYGDLRLCYLRPEAAKMLALAGEALREERPELRLLALDCTRPHSVQKHLWNAARKVLAAHIIRSFVADPSRGGSLHSLGCAIDLTLSDDKGAPLDMGSPYDHLGPEAQPRLEAALRRQGKLTDAQLANRRLLRRVMESGGFLPLQTEWWHFSCASTKEAKKRYRRVE